MLLTEAIELLEKLKIDPSLYNDRFKQRVGRLIKHLGKPKYIDKTIAYWEGKRTDGLGKIEIILSSKLDKVEVRNAGKYATRSIFNQRAKRSDLMVSFNDLLSKPVIAYIKQRLKGSGA